MKFDPTYAPPGYRAVEDPNLEGCNKCAFRDGDCEGCVSCIQKSRPDKCDCYFVKDPDPATVGMGERSFAEWPVTGQNDRLMSGLERINNEQNTRQAGMVVVEVEY